jgi:hypothetical protein
LGYGIAQADRIGRTQRAKGRLLVAEMRQGLGPEQVREWPVEQARTIGGQQVLPDQLRPSSRPAAPGRPSRMPGARVPVPTTP